MEKETDLWRWRDRPDGDGVGIDLMRMGRGWGQTHGDGVEMGTTFVPMSLSSV